MQVRDAVEGFLIDNGFVVRTILVLLSVIFIVGGSSILTSRPLFGGAAISIGILCDLAVLWIYKLEISLIQHEIETTQSEIDDTQSEVDETRDEVETAQDEVSDTKDQIDEMKDNLYEKFGRYRSRDSLESRVNEIEELEDVVEDMEDSLYARSTGYKGRDSLESRVNELEEDLEEEIENLRDELNDWEKEQGGRGRRF